MLRMIFAYGAIGGAIIVLLFQLLLSTMTDHGTWGMVLGFLVMFIGMTMVFVGVKRYRDEKLGGVIRFLPAFGMGLGIAAVASIFYVAGWEAYMFATDYTFMADYAARGVEQMQARGASAADIAAFRTEMAMFAESYRDPLYRIMVTFMEISPIALPVPLISALSLRNPRFLPARA
jgi:uncharacterized membrane protein